MRLQDFQTAVQSLPFGKRLPNAVYVHRGDGVALEGPLKAIVDRLAELHGVGPDFAFAPREAIGKRFRTSRLLL